MFKDEIKPERGVVETLGHGSLLVPRNYVATLYWSLEALRGNYPERIHSTSIKNANQQQFQVAQRWVESFFNSHIPHLSFKATFALQDGPLVLPYPSDDDYQKHWVKSTKSNALAHIRYVYRKAHLVRVQPVFDWSDNGVERNWSQIGIDNAEFEIGERRRKGKQYPETSFQPRGVRAQ